MKKLESCPFCGGKPHRTHDKIADDYSIYCIECGVIISAITQAEVDACWNKRINNQ